MGQVEEGHQGNPNTTDLTGGTSSSRPVLEGSAAQPPGNTNPKPICADDAGCPLPGQCSPTSGPSASLRAPLPSSAFCLGHSSCLHLPSPLTLQLRETTRPCLGPPWGAAWRHPRRSVEAVMGAPPSSPLTQGWASCAASWPTWEPSFPRACPGA